MDIPLPRVTVIIAARPDQTEIKSVAAAQQLDYPADQLEIIVARGKQPSVQRNAALRAARGGLIYFLDDDSVPPRDNLRRAARHFTDPAVEMVGGPNLCPSDAPLVERIFSLVLSSWIAFGPSRARYAPVGTVRASSEKELILCNLMVRRETVLRLGGFNETLYPNEENALMDAIQKGGGKLLYDPGFTIQRRPRGNIRAFAKMLMTYGRGRAEQFRVHPTAGSVLNFVPPMFCVFLVALPFLGNIGLAVLGVYILAVLLQIVALMPQGGVFRSIAAAPFIVLTHILYGLGFWRGLFTSLKRDGSKSSAEVVLENVVH